MPNTEIPDYSLLTDGQFVSVEGPDGIITSGQYDAQTRSLYYKESQVIYPQFHGATHIAEDPIPGATCDLPGLMSSDDKCKLDGLVQTRLGVLGWNGSGFADDGSFLTGDIILAAGTEFISLERIGNVVRFLVDSPTPFNCACEECTQIFWVQDETALASIRPPTCNGKLPGANLYGELKVYLFPESTSADPNNPATTLNNKDRYPALAFKRYDNSILPGAGEFELTLKRNANNLSTTEIGWAFTPGSTGQVQCVWFTGRDDDGNLTRFDLRPETTPDALGAILYKGHLITKQMGVIVDYPSTVISTNQYTVKQWDPDHAKPVGDSFAAKNVWQYQNPENPASGANPRTLILDATIDLLQIGTLVDLWYFKVGETAGEPINRYYFSRRPALNPNHLWNWSGCVQFGDMLTARLETQPGPATDAKIAAESVLSLRDFERHSWGMTGIDDPVVSFDLAEVIGTEAADLTTQNRAIVDSDLPGLRVLDASPASEESYFTERPVWLWHRQSYYNTLVTADIGRPAGNLFSPYDFVFRANIDEYAERYMRVVGTGTVSGLRYVRVTGVHFHDLPAFGTIRILGGTAQGQVFTYNRKLIFPSSLLEGNSPTDPGDAIESIVLVGGTDHNVVYPGSEGDYVELVHQDYDSPVVRVEFSTNSLTGLNEVQFKVGRLDMSSAYEQDDDPAGDAEIDDLMRGLAPGYTASATYSQLGTFTGVGSQPQASPDGFVIYEGGAQVGGTEAEYWNRLEIMVRDSQVWLWWNGLLVPPSPTASSTLPTPVVVNTPYFPIDLYPYNRTGKVGVKLWPGAKLRRMEVRSQISTFNEFMHGGLALV